MISHRLLSILLFASQFATSSADQKILSKQKENKHNSNLRPSTINRHASGAVYEERELQTLYDDSNACTLEAQLGYPFDDPDDAPYKGYHADWLYIQRNNGELWEDWCWGEDATDWCLYHNTGGSTVAYIGNIDDVYYPDEAAIEDELYTEIFTLQNVADTSLTLIVENWHFENDYYANYPEWNDHMMAATLTIRNLSKDVAVGDASGYHYPVYLDVPTHLDDGQKNPEYHGKFSLRVVCDSLCECVASDFTVLMD